MDLAYAKTKTSIIIAVDTRYSEQQRRGIALQVIKRIIERTKKGIDKHGNEFAKYSKSYVNSLPFSLASKSQNVNLILTNNMLNSLQIIDSSTSGFVKIGISNRDVLKAFNHIVGDTVPKRDFLGISDLELHIILAQYKLDIPKDNNIIFATEDNEITNSNDVTTSNANNVNDPLSIVKSKRDTNVTTIRNIENNKQISTNTTSTQTSSEARLVSIAIKEILKSIDKISIKVAKDKITEAKINRIKRQISSNNILTALVLSLADDKIEVSDLQLLLILKELGYENIDVSLNNDDRIMLLRKLFKLKQ
jgi:hypothetical protein